MPKGAMILVEFVYEDNEVCFDITVSLLVLYSAMLPDCSVEA
jgi:hypothetical protein